MSDLSLATPVETLLTLAAESNGDFFTGRQIITFRNRDTSQADRIGSLSVSDATRVASSSDFAEGLVDFNALGDADYVVFDELNIAVSSGRQEVASQVSSLSVNAAESSILAVEPEIFVFSLQGAAEYLRGFSAAVERIRQDLAPGGALQPGAEFEDNAALAAATWGLIATRAASSAFSGRGIKVAILDTGLDMNHPDFRGRPIVSQSFVTGQPPQDGNRHGTHCTGTSCGPKSPPGQPRYGIAHEARIFIGKVLSNSGSGTSAGVLAGMNWAVANRCDVISMSLGGAGGPFAYYTQAGQAALNAGCLIIAAAGNASRRPATIAPTGAPANSPTIVSVAALTQALAVAPFSCGGKVDIAGPGVDVFSSVPMPVRYSTLTGTSMATPHVAGCAALLAQSNPAFRGTALRAALLRSARRLPLPASDVGAGLVQAP
ncbi:S8 family serine peptidase [Roseicella sp. DB1501]|uniref:S8 family serine peptidase n=1 Tax=Roseicella sp. DB1501 TaxID=2730925 RepID=UPI001490F7F5|nr:S8 family serine peptidase [Roseicella sp. DB1501]NOG70427.1 S8 family serine peptidase [Roseicella sp. DB1501]